MQRLRWNNPNNGPIFLCYCSIVANRTNSLPLSRPRRRAGRARAPPRHRLHFTLHRPLVGEAAQAEQGGAHHRILHRHRVRKGDGTRGGRRRGPHPPLHFQIGGARSRAGVQFNAARGKPGKQLQIGLLPTIVVKKGGCTSFSQKGEI